LFPPERTVAQGWGNAKDLLSAREPFPNLYYVLAFVPPDQPNQFFVMSHKEVERERKNFLKEANARKRREGTSTKVGLWPGIPWAAAAQYPAVKQYGDRWRALPK
jgi:hypothetical protein